METQQSIGAWQRATFGPFHSPWIGYLRVDAELYELGEVVLIEDREAMTREMADVAIVLMGMAEQFGINLQDEIDKKMQINRARRWTSNGDGTGQHIEEE